MMGLTARQAELLGFIQFMIAEHGVAPSFAQMAEAIGGVSKSVVFLHLTGLEQRGRIRRNYGEERGISVVARMSDGTPLQFIPYAVQREA